MKHPILLSGCTSLAADPELVSQGEYVSKYYDLIYFEIIEAI
jgi:hypothetical protein